MTTQPPPLQPVAKRRLHAACPFCRGSGRDVTDTTLSCFRCGGTKVVEVENGADLIAVERQRQIDVEGWTPEHDRDHTSDHLARAAACYATPADMRGADPLRPGVPGFWPWEARYWKPTPDDRVRELVKAGALIAAEIDRLTGGSTETAAKQSDDPAQQRS